jgi:hypothetical protein
MSQAQLTSLGVPYTIAMEGPVSDDAAILFAGGFYDSIGAGRDVEFSFRQGITTLRLSSHPDSAIPRLLKKGEFAAPDPLAKKEGTTERSLPPLENNPHLLFGLGIDVSGSMKENIASSLGFQRSRLQGFTMAFQRSAERMRRFLETARGGRESASVFAYAFGMRSGDYCDLFSLMKAADDIISPTEIDRLKAQYTREIDRRYSGNSGLADIESLARSWGLGTTVDSVKSGLRADAEEEVRQRIVGEVQLRLSERTRSLGDTTLNLDDVADLWKGDSPSWSNAEHLIYGNTPMCAVLRRTATRFKAELDHANFESIPVLLLVSDGEPSDGDPIAIGKELREMGVMIVCCYIAGRDVVASRTLVNAPDPSWPNGARVMFDLASAIPAESPLISFLLRSGWSVSQAPRAFLQANRSETLEELVGMAMSPLEAGQQLLPEGR